MVLNTRARARSHALTHTREGARTYYAFGVRMRPGLFVKRVRSLDLSSAADPAEDLPVDETNFTAVGRCTRGGVVNVSERQTQSVTDITGQPSGI